MKMSASRLACQGIQVYVRWGNCTTQLQNWAGGSPHTDTPTSIFLWNKHKRGFQVRFRRFSHAGLLNLVNFFVFLFPLLETNAVRSRVYGWCIWGLNTIWCSAPVNFLKCLFSIGSYFYLFSKSGSSWSENSSSNWTVSFQCNLRIVAFFVLCQSVVPKLPHPIERFSKFKLDW